MERLSLKVVLEIPAIFFSLLLSLNLMPLHEYQQIYRTFPPPLPLQDLLNGYAHYDLDALQSYGLTWKHSVPIPPKRSSFIPKHIEQPGLRHSAPAAIKILSKPSFSACSFTKPEPGTTKIRFTLSAFYDLSLQPLLP